jgi:hypothetical protein
MKIPWKTLYGLNGWPGLSVIVHPPGLLGAVSPCDTLIADDFTVILTAPPAQRRESYFPG